MQPLSIEALDEVWDFITLGLPGVVMLCAEWWAFELLIVFATQLGASAVAYQTIIQQMSSFCFMIPLGLGSASCTVVGNAIGAGNLNTAKSFARIAVFCHFGCAMIISPAILFFGTDFISMFSSDEDVIRMSRRSIPIVAAFTVADGLSAVLSGITRGAGKQHIGAMSNIIAYYSCGLPLAFYFCFYTSLHVVGLTAGIAFAPGVTDIFMSYFIFFKSDFMFLPRKNSGQLYTAVENNSSDFTSDIELSVDHCS
jgi:MATE family multidrug resistance protein